MDGLSDQHRKSFEINLPYLLIVEGEDDYKFFESFLRCLKMTNIQIFCLRGKNNLNDILKTLKNTPGFDRLKSIGIVRDANFSPERSFQSVQSALSNADLPVPDEEMKPAGQELKVFVLLVPGINEIGSLEDLCLRAVANDIAISCVDSYLKCLQKKKIKFQRNLSKARVQAFLASREEYIPNLGIAAQKAIWPFDSSAFNKIREFLKSICI